MGNALQKAAPNGAANKHTVLNNSQTSDVGNSDRSLLNTTAESDNAGTPLVVTDPRSPTDGISRTPIQILRTKSLFRGMFSNRKPPPGTSENGAGSNGQANGAAVDESTSNGGGDNGHETEPAVCITSSVNPQMKFTNGSTTPLNEAHRNGESKHHSSAKNADLPKEKVTDVKAPTVIESPADGHNSTATADTTTENEEAFIVVDNKKKKKKREKAEAKAKEDAKAKLIEQFDRLAPNSNGKALTKVQSDSKLTYSCSDVESSPSVENGLEQNGEGKHRLSNTNENDLPSTGKGFRTKVEKACRSLTNLTSAKSKSVAVNGKAKQEGDLSTSVHNESCTGSSAPTATSAGNGDVTERENIEDSDVKNCNGSGKYMVLVNDE